MSVWGDIRRRADGSQMRKEDTLKPLHLLTAQRLNIPGVTYLGYLDGHNSNPFYPRGLGVFYQVTMDGGVTINGFKLKRGVTIIGYNNNHWDYDYYLYSEKQPIIK